jgi:RND family efflux transporter MFP subunit
VEAQISQRDWHSLSLAENQSLDIRVPAIPDRTFQARVRHLGTSVSKTTMAIPLIAVLDNGMEQFRPGMSVWVEIPTSVSRSTILIPVAAVQRNEMDAFVFVQLDNRTFVHRYVEVGSESGDRIEIKSGLQPGEQIVQRGAFFLKSELLLSEEE